jgi:hypothetical protein
LLVAIVKRVCPDSKPIIFSALGVIVSTSDKNYFIFDNACLYSLISTGNSAEYFTSLCCKAV